MPYVPEGATGLIYIQMTEPACKKQSQMSQWPRALVPQGKTEVLFYMGYHLNNLHEPENRESFSHLDM
jgi:hypothetical protein